MAAMQAASRDWDVHAAELEDRGYTIVPDVLPLELCARARDHMDGLLALPAPGGAASRSHPIPGGIMGELATVPLLLECASALYRSPVPELRLTEQVLIRTDPEAPGGEPLPGPAGGGEPRGWHCDFVFQPQHFHATPRQNYFQMFGVFTDVLPGAACTMVVPGSHKKTMAAAENTASNIEALGALRNQQVPKHAAWDGRSACLAARGSESAVAYDGRVSLDRLHACENRIGANPGDFGIDIDTGVELPVINNI